MNYLPFLAVMVVVMLLMAAFLTVYLKQVSRGQVRDALNQMLGEYRGQLSGEASKAVRGFQEQARNYRLADAARADSLAGMLHRVTTVEGTLSTICSTRPEPTLRDLPTPAALENHMKMREIPSAKRSDIGFIFSMDPARAIQEVIQYERIQDLTTLRSAMTSLQRAYEKARPYLPASIVSDYQTLVDRGRSFALYEDAQDELSWRAARDAAANVAETVRRLPEALRNEMKRPLDVSLGAEPSVDA